jgi:flagella basal body P-ring formation protein FlgA
MKHLQFSDDTVQYSVRIIVCLLTVFILTSKSDHLIAASVFTIRVLEKTEVNEDEIRLREIAIIQGCDVASTEKLGDIVIGKAPLPGKSREVDVNYIKMRLKQNGIDLSRIDFLAPRPVKVLRSASEIPKEKIEKVVRDFFDGKIARARNNIRIKEVKVSDNVIFPKGPVTYRVIPPKNIDFLRTIPLSILFSVNGNFTKKIWATVKFEVLTEAVVAKRPIGKFQLISEEDVFLQKVDLTAIQSNPITSIDEVLGKRTKKAITASSFLTTECIELPPLVKRGDVVLIIAESEGLRITALGEVRKNGCQGEKIRVLNLDSKKAVYARVVDSDTVIVDF